MKKTFLVFAFALISVVTYGQGPLKQPKQPDPAKVQLTGTDQELVGIFTIAQLAKEAIPYNRMLSDSAKVKNLVLIDSYVMFLKSRIKAVPDTAKKTK